MKAAQFKAGGAPMIDKGREEEEEKAEEEGRKHGGRAKRARGGGMTEGNMAHKRHDRPGRKRGGGVGSNLRPLSSANTTKGADGHSADEPSNVD